MPILEFQDVLIAIILGTIMMVMVSEYETKAVATSKI